MGHYLPSEIFEIWYVRIQEKSEDIKRQWRQVSFLASFIVNHSMSPPKRPVKPDDLITFKDEHKLLTTEEKEKEREKRWPEVQERLKALALKSHGKLQTSKGEVLIFDEKRLKKLMAKLKGKDKRN